MAEPTVQVVELPDVGLLDAGALAEAREYLQRNGLVLEGDETAEEIWQAFDFLLAGEADRG
jgi:hypothetical protein